MLQTMLTIIVKLIGVGVPWELSLGLASDSRISGATGRPLASFDPAPDLPQVVGEAENSESTPVQQWHFRKQTLFLSWCFDASRGALLLSPQRPGPSVCLVFVCHGLVD